MSKRDVFPYEMSRLRKTDRDVERILSGKEPIGSGHEDLSLLVAELKATFPPEQISGQVEQVHLAAVMQEARLIPEKGEPVERPGSKATGPAAQASGLPRNRRRPMLSELFASLAVKVAASALAGFTAFGGVAAAGALPDPVQSATADVVAHVGIELPNPAKEAVENERQEEAGEQERLAGAPEEPGLPDDVTLPDEAGVPDHVTLPDEANVPEDIPVGGAAATGAPAVPDHVTLPDEANVPTTVPVRTADPDPQPAPEPAPATDSAPSPEPEPVPVPEAAPMPQEAQVPAEVPVEPQAQPAPEEPTGGR